MRIVTRRIPVWSLLPPSAAYQGATNHCAASRQTPGPDISGTYAQGSACSPLRSSLLSFQASLLCCLRACLHACMQVQTRAADGENAEVLYIPYSLDTIKVGTCSTSMQHVRRRTYGLSCAHAMSLRPYVRPVLHFVPPLALNPTLVSSTRTAHGPARPRTRAYPHRARKLSRCCAPAGTKGARTHAACTQCGPHAPTLPHTQHAAQLAS
jgi:hypothetical protein